MNEEQREVDGGMFLAFVAIVAIVSAAVGCSAMWLIMRVLGG